MNGIGSNRINKFVQFIIILRFFLLSLFIDENASFQVQLPIKYKLDNQQCV